MPEKLIPIGRLVNVHATRGELRLLPFNPSTEALRPGCAVILRRGAAPQTQTHQITAVRAHKRFLLVTFAGCSDMNTAEKLIGMDVCVPESSLPPADDSEIYHYQLIGMRVETQGGELVGTIEEVLPLPSADVCVVRNPRGTEHLIPLVESIVATIDRAGQRLVINPIPGLLDL